MLLSWALQPFVSAALCCLCTAAEQVHASSVTCQVHWGCMLLLSWAVQPCVSETTPKITSVQPVWLMK